MVGPSSSSELLSSQSMKRERGDGPGLLVSSMARCVACRRVCSASTKAAFSSARVYSMGRHGVGGVGTRWAPKFVAGLGRLTPCCCSQRSASMVKWDTCRGIWTWTWTWPWATVAIDKDGDDDMILGSEDSHTGVDVPPDVVVSWVGGAS